MMDIHFGVFDGADLVAVKTARDVLDAERAREVLAASCEISIRNYFPGADYREIAPEAAENWTAA